MSSSYRTEPPDEIFLRLFVIAEHNNITVNVTIGPRVLDGPLYTINMVFTNRFRDFPVFSTKIETFRCTRLAYDYRRHQTRISQRVGARSTAKSGTKISY